MSNDPKQDFDELAGFLFEYSCAAKRGDIPEERRNVLLDVFRYYYRIDNDTQNEKDIQDDKSVRLFLQYFFTGWLMHNLRSFE